MLHKPHPGVPRPAALVLVAHDVLVVGVGVLREVALHQVPGSKLVTKDLNLGTCSIHDVILTSRLLTDAC